MGDLLAQIGLGGFLHLAQNHGGDLLGGEDLGALRRVHANVGLRVLLDNLEGEELDVVLHIGVGPLATDQTLGIEDSVLRVGGQLILGGISNETLTVGGEGHVGGSDAVALIVGNDLNASVLVNTNAAKRNVGISKVS